MSIKNLFSDIPSINQMPSTTWNTLVTGGGGGGSVNSVINTDSNLSINTSNGIATVNLATTINPTNLEINNLRISNTPTALGQVLTYTSSQHTTWETPTSGGGIVDQVNSGTNITINNTDPVNPIVNLNTTLTGLSSVNTGALTVGTFAMPVTSGSNGQVLTTNGTNIATWQTNASGGVVDTVNSGTNITIDNSNLANPIVNLNTTLTGVSSINTGALTIGTFSMPVTSGSNNQVLKTNGTNQATWSTIFTSGVESVNSGANITINNIDPINPIVDLNTTLTGVSSINTSALTVGTFAMPVTSGSNGQVLTTNGTNQATWQTNASGGVVDTVNSGTNITINNSNIANPVVNLNTTLTGVSSINTGALTIGTFAMPVTSGSNGQVLTTNGTNQATWAIGGVLGTSNQIAVSNANPQVVSFVNSTVEVPHGILPYAVSGQSTKLLNNITIGENNYYSSQTTANNNIAIGNNNFQNIEVGSGNIAIGNSALPFIGYGGVTANNNVCIGNSPVDFVGNSYSNTTVIGNPNAYLDIGFTDKTGGGFSILGNAGSYHYTLPNAQGTVGQVIKWPTSGTICQWATDSTGQNAGGIYYCQNNSASNANIIQNQPVSINSHDIYLVPSSNIGYNVLPWNGSLPIFGIAIENISAGSWGNVATMSPIQYDVSQIQPPPPLATYFYANGGNMISVIALSSVLGQTVATGMIYNINLLGTQGYQVIIEGADQNEYNGTYTIRVNSPTSFSYDFAGSTTSLATGNIYVSLQLGRISFDPIGPKVGYLVSYGPVDGLIYADSHMSSDTEVGKWYPVDDSGAGLTFETIRSNYSAVNNVLTFSGAFTVPVNSNSNFLLFSGIPYLNWCVVETIIPVVVQIGGGGTFTQALLSINSYGMQILNLTSVPYQNLYLSGSTITINGSFTYGFVQDQLPIYIT